MPKGGHYAKIKDKRTGRRRRLHRITAEQTLGRPLLATEIVHHRDGNPRNNAPENLLVLPSQAYHAHVEALLRRAWPAPLFGLLFLLLVPRAASAERLGRPALYRLLAV